jgi:four helix bundle protein
MTMQDFKNLLVWQRAHSFSLTIHRVTGVVGRRDSSGIVGQIRRASLSISANIAEGCGRESSADLAKFLQIAVGSASEVESHLQFLLGTGLLSSTDFDQYQSEVVQIRRMLIGLLKKVRARATATAVTHD